MLKHNMYVAKMFTLCILLVYSDENNSNSTSDLMLNKYLQNNTDENKMKVNRNKKLYTTVGFSAVLLAAVAYYVSLPSSDVKQQTLENEEEKEKIIHGIYLYKEPVSEASKYAEPVSNILNQYKDYLSHQLTDWNYDNNSSYVKQADQASEKCITILSSEVEKNELSNLLTLDQHETEWNANNKYQPKSKNILNKDSYLKRVCRLAIYKNITALDPKHMSTGTIYTKDQGIYNYLSSNKWEVKALSILKLTLAPLQ